MAPGGLGWVGGVWGCQLREGVFSFLVCGREFPFFGGMGGVPPLDNVLEQPLLLLVSEISRWPRR